MEGYTLTMYRVALGRTLPIRHGVLCATSRIGVAVSQARWLLTGEVGRDFQAFSLPERRVQELMGRLLLHASTHTSRHGIGLFWNSGWGPVALCSSGKQVRTPMLQSIDQITGTRIN